MKRRILLPLLLSLSAVAIADEDGDDLLGYMSKPATREVATMYVDAVRKELDGRLFCMPEGDGQMLAFDAVKTYLENHPDQRYRPRRYLIIQGLRTAYPCPAS